VQAAPRVLVDAGAACSYSSFVRQEKPSTAELPGEGILICFAVELVRPQLCLQKP